MPSQIWCYLIFGDYGGGCGGGGVPGVKKFKVVQNGLQHILVLEFLRTHEIFEILCAS